MSNDNSNTSPTDIITYIGVPLAVLGILPILWNSALTLWTAFQVRRALKRNHIPRSAAVVRADIVNRVIEVDFERVALSPPTRGRAAPGYWETGSDDAAGRRHSSLPGGSWTLLAPPWEPEPVGRVTQRLQYADELRQPQVEVELRALVHYLLDLGAVPASRGWRALKERELWTKKGEVLLLADGGYSALEVAPRADAEGMLSLRVVWLRGWTTRGPGSLPLGAVRLVSGGGTEAETYGHKPILGADIICQISVSGILSAGRYYAEDQTLDREKESEFDIQHLRSRRGSLHGAWFASMAVAYSMATTQAVLWDYVIPSDILDLATAETVPCGVLVLLGLADNADAPQWMPGGTPSPVLNRVNSGFSSIDLSTDRRTVTTTKDQDPVVARERASENHRRRMAEREEEVRRDHAARSAHVMAALASSRWDPPRVAVTSLRWLQAGGHVDASLKTPSEAAGALLHRIVCEPAFATSVFDMLDAWKVWASAGSGMGRPHLEGLQAHKLEFAVASVLLGVVGEVVVSEVGLLAVDMAECMARWKTVRSG
ncbi:hypothetical protein GGS24DRAFT_201721 [Hypoxylon argillaceum]|nr:hypothetical protein GGS24DRAFT_201721 [Hypoxylon argillaceum]